MPFSAIDALRVLLSSLVFILPGQWLTRRIMGAAAPRGVAGWALGAAFGLGAFGLYLWIDLPLGIRLTHWVWAWILSWALAGAIGFVPRKLSKKKSLSRPEGPDEAGDSWSQAGGAVETSRQTTSGRPDSKGGGWLLGLCILGALAAVPFGTHISGAADAWEYLNRATAILRADNLNAGSPYSPGLHSPYDPTFYGFIAALSKLSGLAPVQVWRVFPIVATPIEIGVVGAASGIIAGSGIIGLAAALLYTVFYGPFFLFRNSVHHQMLADTLFLAGLALLFVYVRQGRKRHLVLGGMAAAAGATFHHFILIQSAFTFGLAGLSLALRGRKEKSAWRRPAAFTVAVALCLLPAALLLLGSRLASIDPKAMDSYFKEVYAPLRHFGPLYIPDPFAWFFKTFWHPIPALATVIYFRKRLRADPALMVLCLLLVSPILVVMNPFVFPLAAKILGLQAATRILNLTTYPSVFLLGWAAVEFLSGRAVRETSSRGLALACVAISLLCILPQTLIRLQGDYSPQSLRREWRESPVSWTAGLDRLRKDSEPGQVVLSDPVTSYSIPTFAPLYVVTNPRADFAFQAPDHIRRAQAVRTVLDPLSSPDSTYAALREYRVGWIVINQRYGNPLTIDKLNLLAETSTGIRHRFTVPPLIAYQVEPDGLPAEGPDGAALLSQLLIAPSTFESFREPGTGVVFDKATGVGAVLGPEEAKPGDTLYVTFYYEWRRSEPAPKLYPKLLREDAFGSRGEWLMRQVRSAILGRHDVILFPRVLYYEEFRKKSLSPGFVFADQFEVVALPESTPGRYGLYAAFGHFPSEPDMGLKLGTVDIVKPGKKLR